MSSRDEDIEMSRPARRRLGEGRANRGRDQGSNGEDAEAQPRSRTAGRSGGLRGAKGERGERGAQARRQRGDKPTGDEAGGGPGDQAEDGDAGKTEDAGKDNKPVEGEDGAGVGAEGGDENADEEADGKSGGLLGKLTKWGSGQKSKKDDQKKKKDENQENMVDDNGQPVARQIFGPMKTLEPLRTDPIKSYIQRSKRLERLTAAQLPELHIVGHIKDGVGFIDDVTEGSMLRFKVDFGEAYNLIGGSLVGQTQFAYCKLDETERVPFNHPIDLHFAQAAPQNGGCPRITMQSYKLDMYGRRILCGYGFTHIPSEPGQHTLEVDMWRPDGTPEQEWSASFLGEVPALLTPSPVYDAAWKERCRLISRAAGTVRMELFVLTRYYSNHGIDGQKG